MVVEWPSPFDRNTKQTAAVGQLHFVFTKSISTCMCMPTFSAGTADTHVQGGPSPLCCEQLYWAGAVMGVTPYYRVCSAGRRIQFLSSTSFIVCRPLRGRTIRNRWSSFVTVYW